MLDKNDFGRKLLEKIKEKKLAPKSRWHFLLKRYVIWGIGIISLAIGALAFSVIIYVLKYNDWDIYDQLTDSFLSFVFLTLPYFWLLFLILFIYIVYYDLRHTKKGYRYSLPIVLAISVGSSMILGALFFEVGLGQAIDDILGQNMPMYERFINRHIGLWAEPENGRLSGLIISKLSEDEIIILSQERMKWDALLNGAEFPEGFKIIVGRPIRLLGEKIDDRVFRAIKVLPVGPGRSFLMRYPYDPSDESMPCGDSDDFCENPGF